jgi:mannose-1-phosphate guanylyltransferase/mannose-6-phosphate isomerase
MFLNCEDLALFPVILCGGSGSRLWPASRPARPKQFLPLLGDLSIFQDTVVRMSRLDSAREVVVVTGEAHLGLIRSQLATLSQTAFIITEPEGRDSAPAIAAAGAWIESQHPGGIAVVVAADHHIPDTKAFCAATGVAAAAARQGAIATFGVKPSQPSTGYGYIEPGEALPAAPGAYRVRRFVEKPSAVTASAYVEAGYLWNSGNFVFRADRLLGELEAFAPTLITEVRAALTGGTPRADGLRLGPRFSASPKISIDYAVMEKTQHAAVVPVDYSWSDLGSWQAIHEASSKDELNNAFHGPAEARSSTGCLIRSATDQTVAILGLDRVAVVVEADAVLVCALDSSQEVKGLVDKLHAAGPTGPGAHPDLVELSALASRLTDWLLGSALPLWWSLGADRARGGFCEALQSSGEPADGPKRLRVQARQVYAYATAGALGWRGPWRDAAVHGLDYLDARYRRVDGLYRTLVEADGAIVNDDALLYDQAFVLLALAAAAKALPADFPRLATKARALLGRVREAYAHPEAGLREAIGDRPYQSNALMHLFEAALTWTQVCADGDWRALADEIGELCCTRLIDPSSGAVREAFDAQWRPASGQPGRIVEPGHQFEWAWLLEQWAWATDRPDAEAKAKGLFAAGERGVAHDRRCAVDSLFDDFSVRETTARLWPQTERMKAAHILGDPKACLEAGQTLETYLRTTVPGLWRDRQGTDGRFADGPAPASSFYHIIAAIAELNGLRIVEGAPPLSTSRRRPASRRGG